MCKNGISFLGCIRTKNESKFPPFSSPISKSDQLDWSEFHVEDAKDNEFGDFWFGIYFPVQTFKEIVQTR